MTCRRWTGITSNSWKAGTSPRRGAFSACLADTRSAFRAFHELVQHRAPCGSKIGAVIAAAAKAHDAAAGQLVRQNAEALCRVRVRGRRVLQHGKRVAREAVGSALEQDELGLEPAQVFLDA